MEPKGSSIVCNNEQEAMITANVEEGSSKMKKKMIAILFSLFLLISCSNNTGSSASDANGKIIIDEENSSINYVRSSDGDLLSIHYRIINQMNEIVGPFYINYLFQDETLQDVLGLDEFSSYKILGGEGIKLGPGEVYQGGDNLNILKDKGELINLPDTENNVIEIQIVDIDTDKILVSQTVDKISSVNEAEK